MKDNFTTDAVIYCRVSSSKQATEGHGLESQEARCRKHAKANGYRVAAVFPDDVSGGGDFMKRAGMVALLSYLDAQPDKSFVVIFDDLKRFARDIDFHRALRRELHARGAIPECLNFRFEDTPENEFLEVIVAAQGELERKQNRRQVIQKMKARAEAGYWLFGPPYGYKFEKVDGHGKLLVRHEPIASIVKTALEGFASGHFGSQAELVRYLQSQPAFPRDKYGEVRFRRVEDMLKQPIYAGYLNFPKWNMFMVRGQHEPLISLDVFKRNQELREGNENTPARIDINEDFPLRGFVKCGSCGHTMTAGWSKGRNAKYPYYFCQQRDCDQKRKSIRGEKIEGEFEALLQEMAPSRELFEMAFVMLEEQWDQRESSAHDQSKAARSELTKLDKKMDSLMNRLVETDDVRMISAYENQVKKLESERVYLHDAIQNCGRKQADFKGTYRTAMEFLSSPCNLWYSDNLADKRLAVKLTFGSGLTYHRNEGYRTAKSTLPFKALGAISGGEKYLVEPRGVEPLTS